MSDVRIEVWCGECGHDFGLELDLPSHVDHSDVRELLREALGVDEVPCPNCGVVGSVSENTSVLKSDEDDAG